MSRIARAHGGMSGGASAGKSGYDLTFAIAYLRDFALLFHVLGESFETFVAWSALEGLCERVGVTWIMTMTGCYFFSRPVFCDRWISKFCFVFCFFPHKISVVRGNKKKKFPESKTILVHAHGSDVTSLTHSPSDQKGCETLLQCVRRAAPNR